jgi:glycogen synthase
MNSIPNWRILYAVGPENVTEAFKYWSKGEDSPSQVSVPYSSQFYEVCQTLGAKGLVIAQSQQQERIEDERFIVERRLVLLPNASGIMYHLMQIFSGLQLLASAIRFRANIAIASSGTMHWFVLYLFSWMGIKIIPSLHCVLWRKYTNVRLVDKITLGLSRNLFASNCDGILAVSHDIAEQVSDLTLEKHPPIWEFFPTFRRSDFANIPEPPLSRAPFRVLFAGRIEVNKGVFDLLEIAGCFAREGRKNIIFDICGDGTALDALRANTKLAGVEGIFVCHGHCNKSQMREFFERSHVVIVPTRTDFVEGFNRVVCESILSGRPVITSAVCPALSYVRDAVIEVPPNDTQAYANALIELYSNTQLYEQKRQACLEAQEQFYDTAKSWGTALKSIIINIQEERRELKIKNS